MSTFDGIVKEFPDIRIDFFRQSNEQSRPPLAYFLSHVHSDHLAGLETCKSPFIYCSTATKEILLRLEKYPHRMNFAKGILESRKQTYRHLKKLLKPLPLETPTTLELSPGRSIRVTLFDANHCVGAVSFLIEGADGRAVLYTGDVRSEPWWVNILSRHPVLIPYVSPSDGPPLKRLDCVYLDTTFAQKDNPYKIFPCKADGLSELLTSVSKYPPQTLFYFDSWTFGYEDVWQALSVFLDEPIHVDDYRYGLYRALANGADPKAPEAAKLIGFNNGNHPQKGCLTPSQSRLHSCEKGTGCDIWNQDFVRITPIITRYGGLEMAELGAGGGQGDLDQVHELETGDPQLVSQLIGLCATKLQSQPNLLAGVTELLIRFLSGETTTLPLAGSGLVEECTRADENEDFDSIDELPLERLVPAIAKLVAKSKLQSSNGSPLKKASASDRLRPDGLPKQITFPYSRHSSYSELCLLIEAFKPKDIHPCTVDKANWTTAQSMSFLFGHIYNAPPRFTHDQSMLNKGGAAARCFEDSPERTSDSPGKSQVQHGALHEPNGRKRRLSAARLSDESEYEVVEHALPRAASWNRRRRTASFQAALDVEETSARSGDEGERLGAQRQSSQYGRLSPVFRSIDIGQQQPDGYQKDAASNIAAETRDRASISSSRSRHGSASPSTAEVRKLFIGNLADDATTTDLRDLFIAYKVDDAYIPPKAYAHTGSRYGHYGFVRLAKGTDARHAVSTLDSTVFMGRRITVTPRDGSRLSARSQRYVPAETRRSLHAADETRLGLRREAFDAATDATGMEWSRIGLLSTGSGHQVKEEEL